MRTRDLKLPLLAALLVASCAAAAASEPPASFELRVVQLPGSLDRGDLVEHLDFLHGLGFNAVWVQARQVTESPLDSNVGLGDAARPLIAWCRKKNVRLIVSLNPALAGSDRFGLSDVELVLAVREFAKQLRREAGVGDLVLSFEDAPSRLTELRDVLEYGSEAAPAHVDLAARVRKKLPRSIRLWLHPEAAHTTPSLKAVAALPPSIGLVWHGPQPVSPRVDATDAERLKLVVGDRPILLRDRYPANQAGNRLPLSVNIGPLRDRDADLVSRLSGHASLAMEDWGASRLTLMTVADWLRSPHAYQSRPSWEAAMRQLAGAHPAAHEALRTQALEWGGPPGGRNHHTAQTDNPSETASVLRDPALMARWRYTLTRYPDRMKALQGLEDTAFRDELLAVMARRLAIARAIPSVRELLARRSAGRTDVGGLVSVLNRLRANASQPNERIALDRFLFTVGVLERLDASEDAPGLRD